jgi:hypothetical protein
MTRASKEKSESAPEVKKRGRKKAEPTVKGLGLFDHIKHIRAIQDPDYYKNLTELDRKTFNPFMILKALSMNPELLDDITTLFRYFDKIPHPQFYTLIIGLIPPDKRFYPWVKGKKNDFNTDLLELIAKFYEVSQKEAEEYATLLSLTQKGKHELRELCRDFGLNEKEVDALMESKDDE